MTLWEFCAPVQGKRWLSPGLGISKQIVAIVWWLLTDENPRLLWSHDLPEIPAVVGSRARVPTRLWILSSGPFLFTSFSASFSTRSCRDGITGDAFPLSRYVDVIPPDADRSLLETKSFHDYLRLPWFPVHLLCWVTSLCGKSLKETNKERNKSTCSPSCLPVSFRPILSLPGTLVFVESSAIYLLCQPFCLSPWNLATIFLLYWTAGVPVMIDRQIDNR